jgi:uncharacterized protein (DUF1684 family)
MSAFRQSWAVAILGPALFLSLLAPTYLSALPDASAAYLAEIQQFRQKRIESLRKNWIVLAGLSWLKPGDNRVGSAADNDVVLTKGPAHAGVFTLNGKDVLFRVDDQVLAAAVEKSARDYKKPTKVQTDAKGTPDIIPIGSLRLTVIERGEKVGVRVKDLESPNLKTFKGTEWFPTDPKLRVEAKWVPATGKKIAITNVLGQTDMSEVPGEAVFTLNGKEFHLDPVQEDPDHLFFIFSDATKGETYPGGRFLYTDMPKDGKVVLDFNTAYSPPCAFTPFATCPLAPKENRLPVRIEAGEKYSGHH